MLCFDDIRAASERLHNNARHTPVLRSPALDALSGATILLKPECLQLTGSFKFRGAYNTIAQLSDEQRHAGVVACSSGNHAQGVALAAQMLGVAATIVMPSDAPATKIEATRSYGAEVILYDRQTEDREALATAYAEQHGAELVHPYDDYRVMAGQGTVGLELAQDSAALGHALDLVLTCCGGGGLTAGIATAFKALSPATEIFTVEPAGFDDYARSLAQGSRQSNAALAGSICDALLAPTPGANTFAINAEHVSGGLSVTDAQVRAAMRMAFQHLKLVLEPGGAVALAAVLTDPDRFAGKKVGVVLSGGNVDADVFARALQE